jgi:hypothetical protein
MAASIVSRTQADLAPVLSTALIVSGCVCLSPVFACATPFAALATLAALRTGLRSALLIVAAVWLANQAIGYGLLGYPRAWNSVEWGLSMGISACFGVLAARALTTLRPAPLAISLPFMAAFAVYEAGLYATAFILPGGSGGFTPSVIGYVFLVNAGGLVVLMLSYHLIVAIGRAVGGQRGMDGTVSSHG